MFYEQNAHKKSSKMFKLRLLQQYQRTNNLIRELTKHNPPLLILTFFLKFSHFCLFYEAPIQRTLEKPNKENDNNDFIIWSCVWFQFILKFKTSSIFRLEN